MVRPTFIDLNPVEINVKGVVKTYFQKYVFP